jgi:hypothetical protein
MYSNNFNSHSPFPTVPFGPNDINNSNGRITSTIYNSDGLITGAINPQPGFNNNNCLYPTLNVPIPAPNNPSYFHNSQGQVFKTVHSPPMYEEINERYSNGNKSNFHNINNPFFDNVQNHPVFQNKHGGYPTNSPPYFNTTHAPTTSEPINRPWYFW